MNETILIIIIAFGIGNHIEKQKPKEMLLEMSDGSIVETVIDDKNNYYCPRYCSAKHKHFSHYGDIQCSMETECYHFVHNTDINIASIIENDNEKTTQNETIIAKTPNVINASVEKKSD